MIVECAIEGRRFTFGDHAVERWRERFRPTLSKAQAATDLKRLLETVAATSSSAPEWAEEARDSHEWLIAGDVALPVLGNGFATTVLARGTPSDRVRATRALKRARRAAARGRVKREGRGPKGSGGVRPFGSGAGSRKNGRVR